MFVCQNEWLSKKHHFQSVSVHFRLWFLLKYAHISWCSPLFDETDSSEAAVWSSAASCTTMCSSSLAPSINLAPLSPPLSQLKNHSLWTLASRWQCWASGQTPAHHSAACCIFVIYLNPGNQLQRAKVPGWGIWVLIFSLLLGHWHTPLSWHWGLWIKQR